VSRSSLLRSLTSDDSETNAEPKAEASSGQRPAAHGWSFDKRAAPTACLPRPAETFVGERHPFNDPVCIAGSMRRIPQAACVSRSSLAALAVVDDSETNAEPKAEAPSGGRQTRRTHGSSPALSFLAPAGARPRSPETGSAENAFAIPVGMASPVVGEARAQTRQLPVAEGNESM
jgi:hypothetical protein